MSKFVKFFGSAHLNGRNVAAYENEDGVKLIAENIVTGEGFGSVQFDSYEDAEEWFDGLPGSNNASRLISALIS